MKSKKKQSGTHQAKKEAKLLTNSLDLIRISEDIMALRTALGMQASLLSDIEKRLKLPAEQPLIPR